MKNNEDLELSELWKQLYQTMDMLAARYNVLIDQEINSKDIKPLIRPMTREDVLLILFNDNNIRNK